MKICKIDLIDACQDYINCYPDRYPKQDFSLYKKVQKFKKGHEEGYFGFINDDRLDVIITGSNDMKDWFDNFDILYEGSDENIKAHTGFFLGWLALRDIVLNMAIKFKVVIVKGHSRGAAIATLGARDIKYQDKHNWKKDIEIKLITGGSPRVYNEAGADDFAQCGIESFRIVNGKDTVTQVPFGFGYKHIGKEIKIGQGWSWNPMSLVSNPLHHYPDLYYKNMKEYKGKI
jgi:predicted lipase